MPIAFVGGVIEFTYYFLYGIFTGDSVLLEKISTEVGTTGLIGTMSRAAEGFVKIPFAWFYDSLVQLVFFSWNSFVFSLYTGVFGVELAWVSFVYFEEVGWVIFDNFYTALQF